MHIVQVGKPEEVAAFGEEEGLHALLRAQERAPPDRYSLGLPEKYPVRPEGRLDTVIGTALRAEQLPADVCEGDMADYLLCSREEEASRARKMLTKILQQAREMLTKILQRAREMLTRVSSAVRSKVLTKILQRE
ncbi:hypothetical protein CYMTET_8212 [Cymbomonas tetramitiformis]|uniref:Uncharacterized protein n=1 Tax=Cymbomonas tetramitiformis TaxID=36881 RepID=A0AAE0GTH9_9CHLO|nr:hypothetical protein CYMTET_8212 [Cymbomonas tetramitiformis]